MSPCDALLASQPMSKSFDRLLCFDPASSSGLLPRTPPSIAALSRRTSPCIHPKGETRSSFTQAPIGLAGTGTPCKSCCKSASGPRAKTCPRSLEGAYSTKAAKRFAELFRGCRQYLVCYLIRRRNGNDIRSALNDWIMLEL